MHSPEINSPTRRPDSPFGLRLAQERGFSLLEMLVSVAIILLLMSAVFPFIMQTQKRFQGNEVVSESNQSARAALEVMSQEIGQAGYNPQFYPNKTSSVALSTTGQPQCIHIDNPPGISGISPGDWVSVDSGPNQELVEVVSTSSAATGPSKDFSGNVPASCSPAPATPWIEAKFEFDHATTPFSISSFKMPYASGILVRFKADGTLDTTTLPLLSNGQQLLFYGDINQDGVINYVVYSISPMVPLTKVCIPAVAPGVTCAAANYYTLYNLYRSIKPVDFPSLPPLPNPYPLSNNTAASPMVEKVLFNTATGTGPTGLPIFAYPSHQQIGTAPNVYTALGTIVITLCVAANPKSMETTAVLWYTMATQIRPLNLQAAINVNNTNGGLYIPPTPASLPYVTTFSGYYP